MVNLIAALGNEGHGETLVSGCSRQCRRQLAQRYADELSGDDACLEETLTALEGVLPEFLPAFRAVLEETRDGLADLSAPATVRDAHADLVAAYDEFLALVDRGQKQLEGGQAPTEALSALFFDRSGNELAQGFSESADRLVVLADREGITGFVGVDR